MDLIQIFAKIYLSIPIMVSFRDKLYHLQLDFGSETNLTIFESLERDVEATASLYTTYRGLIEAGFPIIFSLFLGPWTDSHGTKYPILLPFLGYFLSAVIYFILTFFPDLPPAFILFASIPVALSGGVVALIMSIFSFMSKITTIENRSFRVAMLEGSWFLGGKYFLKCAFMIIALIKSD